MVENNILPGGWYPVHNLCTFSKVNNFCFFEGESKKGMAILFQNDAAQPFSAFPLSSSIDSSSLYFVK